MRFARGQDEQEAGSSQHRCRGSCVSCFPSRCPQRHTSPSLGTMLLLGKLRIPLGFLDPEKVGPGQEGSPLITPSSWPPCWLLHPPLCTPTPTNAQCPRHERVPGLPPPGAQWGRGPDSSPCRAAQAPGTTARQFPACSPSAVIFHLRHLIAIRAGEKGIPGSISPQGAHARVRGGKGEGCCLGGAAHLCQFWAAPPWSPRPAAPHRSVSALSKLKQRGGA